MHPHTPLFFLVALLTPADSYIVYPFRVALSHGVQRMNDLVRNYRVPTTLPSIVSSNSPSQGVDPQWLHALRKSWLDEFDWESRQDYMNRYLLYHSFHLHWASPHVTKASIITWLMWKTWKFISFMPSQLHPQELMWYPSFSAMAGPVCYNRFE